MKRFTFLILIGIIFHTHLAISQGVLIDQGKYFNGLWCYPTANNPLEYRYLPDQIRFKPDENRQSTFRLTTFIKPNNQSNTPLNEGKLSSNLRFVVEMHTPDSLKRKSQQALSKFNDRAKLIGPVLFIQGSYTLSSTLFGNPDYSLNKSPGYRGKMPTYPHQGLAFSLALDHKETVMLRHSLQNGGAGFDLSCNLKFSGITDPLETKIIIDWRTYENYITSASSGNFFLARTEVKEELAELQQSGTITILQEGGNTTIDKLSSSVYLNLIDIFYQPQWGKNQDGKPSSRLGFSYSYNRKTITKKINDTLLFKGSIVQSSNYQLGFSGLQGLYGKSNSSHKYFETVFLEPDIPGHLFQIQMDPELVDVFKDEVRFVKIRIRQKSGIKFQECIITANNWQAIAESGKTLSFHLPEKKSEVYEYQISWSLKEIPSFSTLWEEIIMSKNDTHYPIILTPPLEKRNMILHFDIESLKNQKVKMISIKFSYRLGDKNHSSKWFHLDLGKEKRQIPLSIPINTESISYEILWNLDKQQNRFSKGESNGYIYLTQL